MGGGGGGWGGGALLLLFSVECIIALFNQNRSFQTP